MVSGDAPDEGMVKLASMMIEAGCEGVVGLLVDGHGVLILADGHHPSEIAQLMRDYADAIEGLNRVTDQIGRVVVETEDEM